MSLTLTDEQRASFVDLGLVKFEGILDAGEAKQIEEELWHRFSRWGIERMNPSSWKSLGEATIRKVMKSTRHVRGLTAIYNEHTDAVAKTLTQEISLKKCTPLLLLTFSNQHQYLKDEVVPSSMWHTDTPTLPGAGIPGIIALGCIARVRPQGGGTMVLTGSHRLFETSSFPISSKRVKRSLKRYSYIRDLLSKDMKNRERFLHEAGYVRDVELKVVELTGDPGDVYFVDARAMHTLVKNYQSVPRMMVRGFYETSNLSKYYGQAIHRKKNLTAEVSS